MKKNKGARGDGQRMQHRGRLVTPRDTTPKLADFVHHDAGIKFNEYTEADGPTVFAHACKDGP